MYRLTTASHDRHERRANVVRSDSGGSMPAHRGQNGRCTICNHLERVRIELLMAGGKHQRALARKFKLSRYALGRHWVAHVSPERKVALLCGPVEKAALAARLCEESDSILDHHKVTRAGLYATFDNAVTAGDASSVALLAGKLTEVNTAIARLTGELIMSPLVTHNTLTINGRQTTLEEEVARIDELYAEALERDFPDALAAVRQLIQRKLQAMEGPEELPAIEHEGSHEEATEAAQTA
jgi:hypothetical protein